MKSLPPDLRHGIRVLRASPGFAAVAVLTLAVGIAVATTVFTWVEAILVRPLPGVTDARGLVIFETLQPTGDGHNTSYADYRDYRDQLTLVSGLAVSQQQAFNLGEGDGAERIWGELVSGNYFDVLGLRPARGRFFVPAEQGDELGAAPVAVISARLWRSRFQGDPNVVGRTVRVNRSLLTIVGVAPPAFGGTVRGLAFDLWVPIVLGPQLNVIGYDLLADRGPRGLAGIARLRPGVAIEQARAEVTAVARRLEALYPASNRGFGATLLDEAQSHAGIQGLLRAPLHVLLAMAAVVLLIACVNVTNLLLSRAAARARELSIRLAIGARPWRLVRQMLTESLLVAVMGGAIGVPLAFALQRALLLLTPRSIGLPVALDLGMHASVLAIAVLTCVAAGVVSGLGPALHAMRADVAGGLKEGGRSGTSGARAHRVRHAFVVLEVALALVTLVAAGLFVRSFRSATAIHPGFEARQVLVSRFYLSTNGYSEAERQQFAERLRDGLAASPGISDVSYADGIPLGFGAGRWSPLRVEGYAPATGEHMGVEYSMVAPGFFRLMQIPLLAGRDFTARDDHAGAPSVIVTEALAARYLGGRDPIGRRVHAWGRAFTIVGVVKDSRHGALTEAPRPHFYIPFRQGTAPADVAFFVRTAGEPAEAMPLLRHAAAAVVPSAAAVDALPLADYIAAPMFPQRVAASLLTALGVIGLLLAAVGLYAVMAYAVSERTREIGIRMTLGATPADVLAMVVGRGMFLTIGGMLVGAAVALALSRLVGSVLVHVSPADPAAFAAAALFLAVVALLACYLPARRAARLDPRTAIAEP